MKDYFWLSDIQLSTMYVMSSAAAQNRYGFAKIRPFDDVTAHHLPPLLVCIQLLSGNCSILPGAAVDPSVTFGGQVLLTDVF